VRSPRHDENFRVSFDGFGTSIDDCVVNHVSYTNRPLADDVVKGQVVKAARVIRVYFRKAWPFPKHQPGITFVYSLGVKPPEKALHAMQVPSARIARVQQSVPGLAAFNIFLTV
jgi:hypothetical protein